MDDTTVPHRGAVLITGASTGIGRATALLLDRAGYSVFAGIRKPRDAAGLRNEASARLCPLMLDITDQAQIDAAVAVTRESLGPEGGLKALINNAGIAQAGPIELIALNRFRRQLEVNLIGHVAVIQAFLPLIRQGHGRIINVGSAAADWPMPFLGAYAASKSALRSMSIALRRELWWSGTSVSLILGGVVQSAIWDDAEMQLETNRRDDTHSRYSQLMETMYRILQPSLQKAPSPNVIATAIKKALEARRPRAVYRSGLGAHFAVIASLLPDALVLRAMEWAVKRHRRQARKEGSVTIVSEPGAVRCAMRMLLRFFYGLWLFKAAARPSGVRPGLRFRLRFFGGFPVVEFFNGLCLRLDELLVPGLRRARIEEPIFLIGNPRSGTTILHRVMAEDEQRFFCFRTWEILFPSLLQKRFLSAIGQLDRLAGGHFRALLERLEAARFTRFQHVHRLGLFLTEEDGLLLGHILTASVLSWIFPGTGFDRIARLDNDAQGKRRIMDFYLNCVRRQAWFTGRGRTFLSKNPELTGEVASLETHFPGCHFVYLVRNPLDVVPSLISLCRHVIRSRMGVEPDAGLDERVYEFIKSNYTQALDRISTMPEDRAIIVNYEDLTRQPKAVVQRIYKQFGFRLTPDYERRLDREVEKMLRYRSRHEYSGDQYGVARDRIVADLRPIFDRFGFDTREVSVRS